MASSPAKHGAVERSDPEQGTPNAAEQETHLARVGVTSEAVISGKGMVYCGDHYCG